MNQLAFLNVRVVLCAAIAAAVCTGCAPDDDSPSDVTMFPPAGDGGALTMLDASPIVAADSGVVQPQPDGGVVAPVLDSGPGPVVGNDSGPVMADGGPVVADGGPVVGGDAGPTPDGGMMRADQGQGDGQDVITIGDSWMNLSAGMGIQDSLEKISKRDYRNYGVSGTKLLSESLAGPPITDQYKAAKTADPDIKTVVMTGGGNDILQEILLDCLDSSFDAAPTCKNQIDKVAARLTTFWAEMAADGVQDVLVIGYSRKVNPGGLLGTVAKSVEYSGTKISPACAMVPPPLRCHSLDSDMAVPNLTLGFDGIHPDAASYDAIGAAVWELMKAKGMRR